MIHLLAQHREAHPAVEDQVVGLGAGRPEPVDTARRQQLAGHDLVQQLARRPKELARRGAHLRMLEDGRETSLQLPGVEEEGPVDVGDQCLQVGFERAQAREGRLVQALEGEASPVLARGLQGKDRPRHLFRVLDPQLLLELPVVLVQDGLSAGVEEVGHHPHHP